MDCSSPEPGSSGGHLASVFDRLTSDLTGKMTSTMTSSGSEGLEISKKKQLEYKIDQCSSSSSTYSAELIMEDNPSDQNSRWSSDSNSPPQFLILKLDTPSVVTSITFGKYEKTHVCNLKKFKIMAGNDTDNLVEVLNSGLKNDSVKETFRLRHSVHGHFFPCQYIKIVPIQSWGPSFNFSIWYVALNGDDSDHTVQPALEWHKEYREREAIRLCLKHFRQHNFSEVFDVLQQKTRVRLEHPLLTEIHRLLVEQGDYNSTEELIRQSIEGGLFDSWIDNQLPSPQWTPLILPDEFVSDLDPSSPTNQNLDSPFRSPDEDRQNLVQHLQGRQGQGFALNQRPDFQALRQMQLMQRAIERDNRPVVDPNQRRLIEQGVRQVVDPMLAAAVENPPQLAEEARENSVGDGGVAVGDSAAEDAVVAAVGTETVASVEVLPPTTPGCRGGHQMVIDSDNQTIYLFGGWDGNKDLADFWSYDVTSGQWNLLSEDTSAEGGPEPRSCHKMVLDAHCQQIFLLGRYVERTMRDSSRSVKSDFYMFDIGSKRWTLITDDTSAMGGPNLIFDHQMCLDQENRTIYVFGGQTLLISEDVRLSAERRYSGLYEYHIPTNTWKKRRDDSAGNVTNVTNHQNQSYAHVTATGETSQNELRSRSSHSMLFHPGLRKLFIFGGQRRRDDHLNDFFSYNVDTDEIEIISPGGAAVDATIRAVGHTQRATIDPERNEIHVMTGLNKDKDSKEKRSGSNSSATSATSGGQNSNDDRLSNSFWVYNIAKNTWTCFYKNENSSIEYWSTNQKVEPRPRYAHQLVYDSVNKVHFLFGGNPGGSQGRDERRRLRDFWRLFLHRPTRSEILRRSRLLIRKANFSEMTLSSDHSKMLALKFLQSSLGQVVDHSDPKEEKEFQLLASRLFSSPSSTISTLKLTPESSPANPAKKQRSNSLEGRELSHEPQMTSDLQPCEEYRIRSQLFEDLATFFPEGMTHPRSNLLELLPNPIQIN